MTNPPARDEDTGTLLAEYDARLRGWAGTLPPGARKEEDGPLLRVSGLHRGFLLAPRELGVRGQELDRLIERQRSYFAARGEGVEWKTHTHDLPEELPDRLLTAGFRPEPSETVMVARTDRIARTPASPPPGVVLRCVSSLADLRRLVAMQATAFGEERPWRAEELARQINAAPDETVVVVAETDGQVISGARLGVEPGTGFAGLWGGATLPGWRGRGVYRALVAERARLAASLGARYLYVDALPASAPILGRLGFRPITTTTPYLWSPPSN